MSAPAVRPTPAGRAPWSAVVRRHPLIAFFFLAFALSWAFMVPLVLASHGLIPFPDAVPLLVVIGYGPTFAAVLVTGALGGRAAVRGLLGRLLIWRVGWGWWAAALFLSAGVVLGALGLYALLGNPVPPFSAPTPRLLLDVVLTFLVVGLVNGEEIGWRGFALPRLLARSGVAGSVAVLGTLQALFHLPIFFSNGASPAGGQNGTPFPAFLASALLLTFLFTWLYQHTRGSLLIATVFHASMNAWTTILPFPATSDTFVWLVAAAQLAAVGVVLAVSGAGWITRRPAPSSPVGGASAPLTMRP